MTNERIQKLDEYLRADEEKAMKLLEMEPAAALELINSDGNDFTIDDLKEYATELQKALEANGEMNAEELDNVAGGIVIYPTPIVALWLRSWDRRKLPPWICC